MKSSPLINNLTKVCKELADINCDGWLIYDFRRSNSLGCEILGIPKDELLTRRFYYWLPAKGSPIKLSHAIEKSPLQHLPGEQRIYRTWQELETELGNLLTGSKKIAMEYSPRNRNPYLSKVDGGTLELIRSFGVDVISSENLLQPLNSTLSNEQIQAHFQAAKCAEETICSTWNYITDALKRGKSINEWSVSLFVLDQFKEQGFITDAPPICAVNANSANPHYVPYPTSSSTIKHGDYILLDIGCKLPTNNGIYSDYTHVAIAASKTTDKQQKIFEIVKQARDKATKLIIDSFATNQPLRGCDVDNCCRQVIKDAGYGDYFIHRTGHNIGEDEHGNGTHMDGFETNDTRLILLNTCFSIEPGIYLPGEFGVRLEQDILIDSQGKVHITGAPQSNIKMLF